MRPAVLLAVALLAPAFAAALPAGAPDDAWRAKADAPLLAALDAGAAEVAMVVQGPALPAPDAAPPDRAGWRAHWAAAAEPFLAALRAHVAARGGEVTLEVPAIGGAFVRLAGDRTPGLLAMPGLRRAGLDAPEAVRIVEAEGPDEPGLAITSEDAVRHLRAQEVWVLGYRGQGVRVAVTDTGIRETHEVFRAADGASRVVAWHDVIGGCATPCDPNGHGTRVAHLAAGGDLFNPSAPEGAAPRADLVGVRIFGATGSGTWEQAQAGLQAAFDIGADVAANAWGGSCTGAAITTGELAEALADAGMLSVFPGGAGSQIGCPAGAEKVVTTGFTDDAEVRASNSAPGPCTWANVTRVCPDVMAVAVNLQGASSTCDTCYSNSTGSSWGTAQVAGVAALLVQAAAALHGTDLPPARADVLLRFTARDLGEAGPDDDYGHGMADALAAVQALEGQAVRIRYVVTAAKAVVHGWDSNTLTVAFANLGDVAVSGHVRAVVDQVTFGGCPPACAHLDLLDADVVLGPLEETVTRYLFDAAAHPPGSYRLRVQAAFDGPEGDGSQAFDISQVFLVKKVVLSKVRSVPPLMITGQLAPGTLVYRNVGNEAANAVKVAESFDPRSHAPVPLVPPGEPPEGLFATPPPDDVDPDRLPGRMDYRWTGGFALAPGEAWVAHDMFLAAAPADVAFRGTIAYQDETGHAFLEAFDEAKRVILPAG